MATRNQSTFVYVWQKDKGDNS